MKHYNRKKTVYTPNHYSCLRMSESSVRPLNKYHHIFVNSYFRGFVFPLLHSGYILQVLSVPRLTRIVIAQRRNVAPWTILPVILKLGLVSVTKVKNICTLCQLVNVKKLRVSNYLYYLRFCI